MPSLPDFRPRDRKTINEHSNVFLPSLHDTELPLQMKVFFFEVSLSAITSVISGRDRHGLLNSEASLLITINNFVQRFL